MMYAFLNVHPVAQRCNPYFVVTIIYSFDSSARNNSTHHKDRSPSRRKKKKKKNRQPAECPIITAGPLQRTCLSYFVLKVLFLLVLILVFYLFLLIIANTMLIFLSSTEPANRLMKITRYNINILLSLRSKGGGHLHIQNNCPLNCFCFCTCYILIFRSGTFCP